MKYLLELFLCLDGGFFKNYFTKEKCHSYLTVTEHLKVIRLFLCCWRPFYKAVIHCIKCTNEHNRLYITDYILISLKTMAGKTLSSIIKLPLNQFVCLNCVILFLQILRREGELSLLSTLF